MRLAFLYPSNSGFSHSLIHPRHSLVSVRTPRLSIAARLRCHETRRTFQTQADTKRHSHCGSGRASGSPRLLPARGGVGLCNPHQHLFQGPTARGRNGGLPVEATPTPHLVLLDCPEEHDAVQGPLVGLSARGQLLDGVARCVQLGAAHQPAVARGRRNVADFGPHLRSCVSVRALAPERSLRPPSVPLPRA